MDSPSSGRKKIVASDIPIARPGGDVWARRSNSSGDFCEDPTHEIRRMNAIVEGKPVVVDVCNVCWPLKRGKR